MACGTGKKCCSTTQILIVSRWAIPPVLLTTPSMQLIIFSALFILSSCSGKQSKNEKEGDQENKEPVEVQHKKSVRQKSDTAKKAEATESEMIFFEGGEIMMGSKDGLPNERPVHKVPPLC